MFISFLLVPLTTLTPVNNIYTIATLYGTIENLKSCYKRLTYKVNDYKQ